MKKFTFDDITILNYDFLNSVLNRTDYHTLINALRTANQPVLGKILDNLPRNTSEKVKSALKNSISICSENESEKSQMEIIKTVKFVNYCGWYTKISSEYTFPDFPPCYDDYENKSKVLRQIEWACEKDSGRLYLHDTTEDEVKKGFDVFQNRLNEIKKIHTIAISIKLLPLIMEYIDVNKIEELVIWDYDSLNEFIICENFINLKRLKIKDVVFIHESISKLQSLTKLTLEIKNDVNDLSGCICTLKNLSVLDIYGASSVEIYDWIGNLQSLKELTISFCKNLVKLPENIGNLKNLTMLKISSLPSLEKLPENIGNLNSLTYLSLHDNEKLKTLPDSIGNIESLTKIYLSHNKELKNLPEGFCNLRNLINLQINCLDSLEDLPNNIDKLQSLKVLSLKYNKNLITLPDSIGNMPKLKKVELNDCISIKYLPEKIKNLSSLESINLFGTGIKSVPEFSSSIDVIIEGEPIEVFPEIESISYRSFINSYYILLRNLTYYSDKARREGILAIEEEIKYIKKGFFTDALHLLVYGVVSEDIRKILNLQIVHENDFYRKKLMEIAMEGVCCIENHDSLEKLLFSLNLMVDIKDNPVDIAYENYLAGNRNAFYDIDFSPYIIPEEEREEIRLTRRIIEISEKTRRDGIFGLERVFDDEAIKAKDVFEYGISLLVEYWSVDIWMGLGIKYIDTVLEKLVQREIDPVQKNLAAAKKQAVLSIYAGDNSENLIMKLTAFFDKNIAKIIRDEFIKDQI